MNPKLDHASVFMFADELFGICVVASGLSPVLPAQNSP
jgi:hypothetical protein